MCVCARAGFLSAVRRANLPYRDSFLRHDAAVHAPVLADAHDAHHADARHPAHLHREIRVVRPVDGWRGATARGYR